MRNTSEECQKVERSAIIGSPLITRIFHRFSPLFSGENNKKTTKSPFDFSMEAQVVGEVKAHQAEDPSPVLADDRPHGD